MPYAFEDRPAATDPHLELWKAIAHRVLLDEWRGRRAAQREPPPTAGPSRPRTRAQ